MSRDANVMRSPASIGFGEEKDEDEDEDEDDEVQRWPLRLTDTPARICLSHAAIPNVEVSSAMARAPARHSCPSARSSHAGQGTVTEIEDESKWSTVQEPPVSAKRKPRNAAPKELV